MTWESPEIAGLLQRRKSACLLKDLNRVMQLNVIARLIDADPDHLSEVKRGKVIPIAGLVVKLQDLHDRLVAANVLKPSLSAAVVRWSPAAHASERS